MADGKRERISADKQPDILKNGDVLKGRWWVLRKISAGGFGQVYLGEDRRTGAQVAIKVELVSCEKQLIKMEVAVLKAVQGVVGEGGEGDHVPAFLGCGRTDTYNFIIMSLLGENLAELRKQRPEGKFSLPTVCYLCCKALEALRVVHKAGVLHRDVKPSNFAVGLGAQRRDLYILDFGLARFYRTQQGVHLHERSTAGFRGTSRYASLNAHKQRELSRRDDLWSLFYMVVELAKGGLPWRKLKLKPDIEQMKHGCPPLLLAEGLPDAFKVFAMHIVELKYDDEPNYDLLIGCFQHELVFRTGSVIFPLDWENSPVCYTAPVAVPVRAVCSNNAVEVPNLVVAPTAPSAASALAASAASRAPGSASAPAASAPTWMVPVPSITTTTTTTSATGTLAGSANANSDGSLGRQALAPLKSKNAPVLSPIPESLRAPASPSAPSDEAHPRPGLSDSLSPHSPPEQSSPHIDPLRSLSHTGSSLTATAVPESRRPSSSSIYSVGAMPRPQQTAALSAKAVHATRSPSQWEITMGLAATPEVHRREFPVGREGGRSADNTTATPTVISARLDKHTNSGGTPGAGGSQNTVSSTPCNTIVEEVAARGKNGDKSPSEDVSSPDKDNAEGSGSCGEEDSEGDALLGDPVPSQSCSLESLPIPRVAGTAFVVSAAPSGSHEQRNPVPLGLAGSLPQQTFAAHHFSKAKETLIGSAPHRRQDDKYQRQQIAPVPEKQSCNTVGALSISSPDSRGDDTSREGSQLPRTAVGSDVPSHSATSPSPNLRATSSLTSSSGPSRFGGVLVRAYQQKGARECSSGIFSNSVDSPVSSSPQPMSASVATDSLAVAPAYIGIAAQEPNSNPFGGSDVTRPKPFPPPGPKSKTASSNLRRVRATATKS